MGGRVNLLLKIALLLQSTCYSIQVDKENFEAPALDEGTTFLDSLMRPGTDMVATLGLELLEGLTQQNAECRMNLSRVDMKYTKRMSGLVKYHQAMEKLVSMPKFSEFSNEDRTEVEANFLHTVKYMEVSRNKELRQLHHRCNSTQQDWLTGRFLLAVSHARNVLDNDMRQYVELRTEMVSYRSKMQRHVVTCQRSKHSFDLMYCYVEELETLLYLIDQLLEAMDHMVVTQYGDDEDLAPGGQGSGVEEFDGDSVDFDTTQHPSPIPITSKIPTIKVPPGFFGVGPVIIRPHSDTTSPSSETETTPTRGIPAEAPSAAKSSSTPSPDPATMPTNQLSTPTSGAGVSVSRNQPLPSTGGDSSEIPPVTSSSPPKEAAPWLDSAFEEVLSLKDQTTEPDMRTPSSEDTSRSDGDGSRRAGGSKTSKRRPSQQPRPPAPRPDSKVPLPSSVDIELQGSYDGQQVDFRIEVGDQEERDPNQRPDHAHGRPVVENIILEPAEQEETPHPTQDKSSWTYTNSILTFFLGVIVVVFIIIVLTIVSINRLNKKRRRQKLEPPVLSEKDMLDVMKKTGYVNPTYKYYTQS